jgi:hypothetical protein
MEARRGDPVAQAINLWDSKGTLGRVDAEAIGGQHIKDLLKVEEVLLSGWAENEEIIQVNEKEGKGAEKGVHEALESLGSIFEAKRHEIELEEAKGSFYCCLWDVVFLHGHLIITLLQVQFGKNGGTMEMGR